MITTATARAPRREDIDAVLAPYPGTQSTVSSLTLPSAALTEAVHKARFRDLLAAARATIAADRLHLPNPLGWLEDELAAYELLPDEDAKPSDFVRPDEDDDVWGEPRDQTAARNGATR